MEFLGHCLVFFVFKMGYEDSTSRLDRFSHIALKLTLGFQNLFSFFRLALFDGEIFSNMFTLYL